MLIGLVGQASVGKSTFFKAATLAEVEIAAYPFTTIKPNHGAGFVRVECVEKEFNTKCNPRVGFCLQGTRFVAVDLLDVAGLVPGAHEGKGLGLEFLNDLNQADVLVHVVDASGSTNERGEQVHPLSYDPAQDINFLEFELGHWFFNLLMKGWEKFTRIVLQENLDIKKALAKQLSGLKVSEDVVQGCIKELGLSHLPGAWSRAELFSLASLLRRKTKPMIIAANKADVEGAKLNIDRLQQAYPHYKIIPCAADAEVALREAAKKELIEYIPGASSFTIKGDVSIQQEKALQFIQKSVLDVYKNTGVQQVLDAAVFDVLQYIAVFPGGIKKLEDSQGRRLPDCFLLPQGSTALDFAFKIHTDLGKGFVRAMDVRKKIAMGKDQKLKHRDVVEILSSK